MAKKRKFHLTKPDIRVRYLGSDNKQKVEYLRLPADFGEDMLMEDIASGAEIYKSFPETLRLSDTRYNIITAPTEEDGLRAQGAQIAAATEISEDDLSGQDHAG